MQAVCEIVAAFVTALAAAAFSHFGVTLEAPAQKAEVQEVRRTPAAAPASTRQVDCTRPSPADCPKARVKAA